MDQKAGITATRIAWTMPTLSITFDVEEWFDTLWFKPQEIFSKYYDGKQPMTRIGEDVDTILNLLKIMQIKATFFVLGRVASGCPSIVPSILEEGHEVATHGFSHTEPSSSMEFDRDVTKSIETLSQQGAEVKGYRAPNLRIRPNHLARLPRYGIEYDSSAIASLPIPNWYGSLSTPPHPHVTGDKNQESLVEIPIAVFPIIRLPLGNSWTYRNLPNRIVEAGLHAALHRFGTAVIYIHTWEFTRNPPNHGEIPWHVFRNCGQSLAHRLMKTVRNLKDTCTIVPARDIADTLQRPKTLP